MPEAKVTVRTLKVNMCHTCDFSRFRFQERHLAEVLTILLSHLYLSQHLFNMVIENRKTVGLACLGVTTFIPAAFLYFICMSLFSKRKVAKEEENCSARSSDGFKVTAVSNNTCDEVHECVMAARADLSGLPE